MVFLHAQFIISTIHTGRNNFVLVTLGDEESGADHNHNSRGDCSGTMTAMMITVMLVIISII